MEFTNQKLYAGATWSFTELLSEFPASSGYALVIYLQHDQDTAVAFSSTASGDDYVFLIDAATTAALTKRNYKYQAIITKSGEVEIYEEGTRIILPALTITSDTRTDNQIILDALIATLKNRATREQSEIEIAGRKIKYMPLENLAKAISQFRYFVKQEGDAAKIQNGEDVGGNIKVRFNG